MGKNRLEEEHALEVHYALKKSGYDYDPDFSKANIVKNQIDLKETAISTLELHIKNTIVDPEYS